jgi:hypothetical protein
MPPFAAFSTKVRSAPASCELPDPFDDDDEDDLPDEEPEAPEPEEPDEEPELLEPWAVDELVAPGVEDLEAPEDPVAPDPEVPPVVPWPMAVKAMPSESSATGIAAFLKLFGSI